MKLVFDVADDGEGRVSKLKDRHAVAKSQYVENSAELKSVFAGMYSTVGSSLDEFAILSEDMARNVPKRYFDRGIAYLEGLMDCIEQIVRFKTSDFPQGWSGEVNRISQEFERIRVKADEHLVPFYTWYSLALHRLGFDEGLVKLNEAVERGLAKEKQIDDALKAVQDATSELGIQDYAKVFSDEYERYKRNAWMWLGSFFAAMVVGVWVIWKFVERLEPLKQVGQEIHPFDIVTFVGIKLLLIAVFFLVVTLTLRSHFAARHNAILNKHRACSMQSFQLFVHGAADDGTKDAIRKIAAASIFTMQRSGMLGKDHGPSSPINLTEIGNPWMSQVKP